MLSYGKLAILEGQGINGGHLEYGIDPDKGVITYSGEIICQIVFMSKTFPLNGATKVDPAVLQSKNLKPGLSFKFANLEVDVVSVSEGVARCFVKVIVGGSAYSGTCEFDLSKDVIALTKLTANGSKFGFTFELKAVAIS